MCKLRSVNFLRANDLLFVLTRRLGDDALAWNTTKDDALMDIPAKPNSSDLQSSGISEDRPTWTSAAPETIAMDQLKLGQWILITHGGFITHIHHDAAGLATWICVQGGGLKIWAIVVPKVTATHRTRENIFALFEEVGKEPWAWTEAIRSQDIADIYWAFLEPGQTL